MPAAEQAAARRPAPVPGRRAYDLTPGRPDLAGFPRSGWLAAARKAITAAPSHELGYPDPRGLPGLRETLAQYLARVRGVRTAPDRIIICSGFVQALTCCRWPCSERGAGTVAVESYGFGCPPRGHPRGRAGYPPGTGGRVGRAGQRTGSPARPALPVRPRRELPRRGPEPPRRVPGQPAGGAAPQAECPAHARPSVPARHAARRPSAGPTRPRWARDSGALIIEDDYDGEFRYDRRPFGALQGLAPGLVAYAGTASKSLAPGLSLAWLVLPPHLVDLLVQAKRLSDGHTGVPGADGAGRIHQVGCLRPAYPPVPVAVPQAARPPGGLLAERSPEVTVTGIAAGLHAVLRLGRGPAPGRTRPGSSAAPPGPG